MRISDQGVADYIAIIALYCLFRGSRGKVTISYGWLNIQCFFSR